MTHYDICLRSAKALTPNELLEMIEKLDKATLMAEELEMFKALNDEYASRWSTQENYNRLHDDAKMGGSFHASIIDTFFKADNNNKPRLVRAFPEIFVPSAEWQEREDEYQRRRELKQAIRSTHKGSMGDPMTPTTR